MQGAKHVDVSAWHSSSCENANYSKAKAQIGIADHQACAALCWAENPCKNYHSAFSSEQPRLVALPTGRSNDSKLATSLWGPSHHDHYSGAAVGPGSYEALEHNFVVPKYKAILHACCSNDLGLPQSLEQSKRVSIAALVHRYSSCKHMHITMSTRLRECERMKSCCGGVQNMHIWVFDTGTRASA